MICNPLAGHNDLSVVNSRKYLRLSAIAMIATLVLFPAVTRLLQLGVPQNAASFSGTHRSGIVPSVPVPAVPADPGQLLPPEPLAHPADGPATRYEPRVAALVEAAGLRAPPPA